jgi:hypothetical protein
MSYSAVGAADDAESVRTPAAKLLAGLLAGCGLLLVCFAAAEHASGGEGSSAAAQQASALARAARPTPAAAGALAERVKGRHNTLRIKGPRSASVLAAVAAPSLGDELSAQPGTRRRSVSHIHTCFTPSRPSRCVCVCVCARACVRACVCVCARVCVCVSRVAGAAGGGRLLNMRPLFDSVRARPRLPALLQRLQRDLTQKLLDQEIPGSDNTSVVPIIDEPNLCASKVRRCRVFVSPQCSSARPRLACMATVATRFAPI